MRLFIISISYELTGNSYDYKRMPLKMTGINRKQIDNQCKPLVNRLRPITYWEIHKKCKTMSTCCKTNGVGNNAIMSCPPKRGAGAGVGVGMLWGGGDSFDWK